MASVTFRERFFGPGPVTSRVSWGAIFAGAVVAFAVYFLLATFGAAIGLSISENVRSEGFATGAASWAIFSMLVALFAGGWVATRCATGETLLEAVLYGAIVWGIMFVFLTWLAGVGMKLGFNTMMERGTRNVAVIEVEPGAQPGAVRQGAVAPQETTAQPGEVTQVSTKAAWWVFLGTLISMGAAIGGAIVGSPRELIYGATYRAEVTRRETDINPPI
jgi:hypothetical protein